MNKLIILLAVFCISLSAFSQVDTTKIEYTIFESLKKYEVQDALVINNCLFDKCNFDTCKIEIQGDTMKVVRMILKYYDLRNKQYFALLDLVQNLSNEKYKYYLKRYEAVRDSTIK